MSQGKTLLMQPVDALAWGLQSCHSTSETSPVLVLR